MEKKIMVTVDDSRYSKNAVRYASQIYATLGETKLTLMHIQPTISQYLLDEAKKKPRAHATLEKVNRKHAEAAQILLDGYQEQLIQAGTAEGDISLATQPRNLGVAKDILEYAVEGRFDAVIMGRRGISGLEEVFLGSVSANVVDQSGYIPIWLVGEPDSSKNILLAVDGSENALRAVDHLAFMVGGQADTKITFFHVSPRLQDYCPVDFDEPAGDELEEVIRKGHKDCIDRFFAHAQQKLREAGINENQFSVKIAEGKFRVGKSVLNEFLDGDYGTLIVGRRGMNKQFFTGSVSRYLSNGFSEGVLWVVP